MTGDIVPGGPESTLWLMAEVCAWVVLGFALVVVMAAFSMGANPVSPDWSRPPANLTADEPSIYVRPLR